MSAKWTQRAITCIRSTDTEIAVFWVGIDGLNTGTVEQDGTLAICQNGVSSASARTGTKGVIKSFPDDQIFMVNSSSAALANPSALNAAGNGFKVTWKASA